MTGKATSTRRKAPSARIQGERLDDRFGTDGGLIDLLQAAADPAGGHGVVFVRADGGETFVSYSELFDQARARLAGLRRLGLGQGDIAVLCHADSAAFVRTFWACVLGGIVPAATAYPTAFRAGNKEFGKLADIAAQLGGPPVLTDATLCERLPGTATEAESGALHPIDCARLDDAHATPEPTPGRGNDLALIQYSSGSTGWPKGVMITHGNVLANMEGMVRGFEIDTNDVFGAWLPYHHDFGLMCFHILPVAARVTQVNLAPSIFLRRPALWLQKIQERRVSVTGAPNFGYMHTLRSVGDKRCGEYDLASVRLIINGAEPISVATMRRFMDAVAPAGVPRAAMTPGYGMAEATLTATITPPGETPLVRSCDHMAMVAEKRAVEADDGARTTRVVDEGYPVPGMEVRIVGDGGGQVREGRVGHIQLAGPHVTPGYFGNADATAETRAERWLWTGDLGFIRDGRLSITGRAKDVIFVNGENHFAHDLEAVAESVAGVAAGSAAACGWHDEAAGRECTVLFVKVKNPPEGSNEHDVLHRSWARVSEDCGVVVDHVVPGVNVPRTTSGKAQRFQLLQRFRAGEFDDIAIRRTRFDGTAHDGTADGDATDNELRIRAVWAGILGIPADRIDPEVGFRTLGGTSVQAVQMLAGLERAFGRVLDYDLLLQCSSVREMARYLEAAAKAVGIGTDDADNLDAAPLDIAVIGVAGRFPGADGVEAFWDNLMKGVESVGEVPAGRWPLTPYWSPTPGEPGTTCSRWGGFLADAYSFDACLFGIDADEAVAMDPQQRHFMEITWQLLERAGQLRQWDGKLTGVFVGASHNPYMEHHRHNLDLQDVRDLPAFRELAPEHAERFEREWRERFGVMDLHPNTAVDNLLNMIAARTSSTLDLKGPSLAVDTACSSSLVAVHLAIESLQRGECDTAVAGGVNVMSSPTPWQLLSRSGALSPTGRSRTFDANADGLVPGEGVGAVLLKPLAQAVVDGDPVEAVICATSMNNDGSALGPMAPNPDGQRSVIERTYRRHGIDPASVEYIEAHGTGTRIGDPSEVRALSQAWKALGVETGERPVGSVKANIGHLLSAAGIASLIKVIGSMRRGLMPPSVALEQCAPEIGFERTPFAPITDATPWPSTSGPRRAAVSSFGFGGTNCHMVVDGGAVTTESTPAATPSAHLLCCSAHTEAVLQRRLQDLAGALARGELAPATAAAALRRRDPGLAHRAAAIVTGADDVERLAAARPVRAGHPGGVVLMCTGQGAQYPGMTRSLAANAPGFRRHLDDCARAFAGQIDIDLLELLFGESGDCATLARTRYTQPVVFAVDYAVGRWLLDSGLEPDLVMGHSVGELAAACLAGVFSLTDAARIVAARARLMDDVPDPGGMLAVFDGRAAVKAALERWPQRLWLAACNGSHVVVAGETDALEEYLAELQATGCSGRRLEVSNAFHTPLMEPMLAGFGAELEQIGMHVPRWPLLSNETGDVAGDEIATPAYWQRHVVSPVRFEQAVTTAIDRGADVFVEAGPDRTLSPLVRAVASGAASAVVSALHRREDDWQSLMGCWKTLFEVGVTPTSRGFDVDQGRDPRGLPDYPLERREYRPEQRLPHAKASHPVPREEASRNLLHGWYWRETGEPAAHAWPVGAAAILVNEGALAQQVIAGLCLHVQPIYVVEVGDAWARKSTSHFCIDPANPDDYERLFDTIGDLGLWVDLRHCDAAEGGSTPDASGMHALAIAFGRRSTRPARLLLVSENALFDVPAARSVPGRAPIDAVFADAIAETWPEMDVGVLDLDCTAPAHEKARRILGELGLAELEPVTAWHGDKRLVRELRTLANQPATGVSDLGDGDTVVITGGLGDVGREVARYLAGQARVQLVLVGRREPDAQAHAFLAELAAAGTDAVYRRADVTDEVAMAAVVEDTQTRLGSITGIIHAAGTADAERLALAEKTPASIAAVLAPKTTGAAILDRLTRTQPLRWFVLFGSVTATHPRMGARFLADYAAANAWLDAYARWRAGTHAPGRSLTIHWSIWGNLGLGRQDGIDALARATGLVPLSRQQGVASLDRLLAPPADGGLEPVVHVFDQRPSTEREAVAYPAAAPSTAALAELGPATVPRTDARASVSPASAAASYVELIRQQLATELGVAIGEIAPSEKFLDQGLSSADAARVLAALAERLGVRLYPTLLFEFQTADALAEYLEQTHGPFAPAEPAGVTLGSGDAGDAAAVSPAADTDRAGDDDIAIIGMGCRTAGAEDLYAFRELVFSGRTSLGEVPPERWDPATQCDRDGRSGKSYVTRGGFLDAPFDFDPMFFGLSPCTAAAMDPQQRVFLEVVWHTLQHAGYGGDHRPGRTGVFVGCEQNQYLQHFSDGIRFDICREALAREPDLRRLSPEAREACLRAVEQAFQPAGLSSDVVPGNGLNQIAARISHWLDLSGPALALNTACSSGVTALHIACQSLRAGDCEAALVGAVHLNVGADTFVLLSEVQALSPNGDCRPFDADASGMVLGEGAGAVVLKPLGAARRDGDRVHAIIRGSAVNNDGRSQGLTAPNPAGQADAIARAYGAAAVDPGTVNYIEAHGTGTVLGDPIEIEGLRRGFEPFTERRRFCTLASLKAVIGHTLAASSILGVIRGALAFGEQRIPPTPGYRSLNPHIDLETSPAVPGGAVSQPLTPGERPHRLGVSAFGFGGTNGHVVLEEGPAPARTTAPADGPHLVCLSGRTGEQLSRIACELRELLDVAGEGAFAGLCASQTLATRRMYQRMSLVVWSAEELRRLLVAVGEGEVPKGAGTGASNPTRRVQVSVHLGRTAVVSAETAARLARRFPVWGAAYEAAGGSGGGEVDRAFAAACATATLLAAVGLEPVWVSAADEALAACVSGEITMAAARRRLGLSEAGTVEPDPPFPCAQRRRDDAVEPRIVFAADSEETPVPWPDLAAEDPEAALLDTLAGVFRAGLPFDARPLILAGAGRADVPLHPFEHQTFGPPGTRRVDETHAAGAAIDRTAPAAADVADGTAPCANALGDRVRVALAQTDPQMLISPGSVGGVLGRLGVAAEGPTPAVSRTDTVGWIPFAAVVARQTGLSEAVISADLHLEGDLGLDSLKTVELLNALAALHKRADGRPADMNLPTDQLLEAQTVGELYAILEPLLVAAAEAAPADATVPAGSGASPFVVDGPDSLTVLDAQYVLLAAHNVVTTCSLASYVRLGGPIDPERGRAAWGDLIARHPTLRVRFDWPEAATRLAQFEQPLVADTTAPPIEWLETQVLADGVDEAIEAVLESALNFEWNLRRWPLHRLLALQTATGDTVLFFAVNHLIADGLSIQPLIHEFLELYRARIAGEAPQLPLCLSAGDYNAVAERINTWSSRDEEAHFTEYARTQGKRRYHWNPEERAVEGPCRNARRSHRLSTATTQRLVDWTREAGMPLSTLLTAAYLRAAERLQSSDGAPIVNIPTAGRVYPGVDARHAVGCFAQNMSLDFPRAEGASDGPNYLARVHDCYATGIAHGYDRMQNKLVARTMRDTEMLEDGAVKALASSLLTSMVKTNLYLPYLGTVPLHSSYGSLVVRDYAAATSTNPGTVDTIAEIFDGRLQLAAGYDAGCLSAGVVNALLAGVETALQELVRCPVPEARAVPTAPVVADDSLAVTARWIAEEVGRIRLGPREMDRDLEADLGLDSLERVRMISRLGQTLNRPIDRRALLDCRSLQQMVAVLAHDEANNGDAKPVPKPVEAAATSAGRARLATDEPPPGGAGVPCHRIMEQCRRTPRATAVLDQTGALTYAELDERSNRLGRQLRDIGSGRGAAPVGILLEPGADMVVAMLAAMKAGVPYVPLDATHPPARLRYVVGHSGMSVVIAAPDHARTLDAGFAGERTVDCVVSMGGVGDLSACAGVREILAVPDWTRRSPEALKRVTEPDDPMLVLYTSGSTGRPKGVLLGHRGYDSRLLWMQRAFQLRPGEHVAQKTSCGFDVSVWELLWPLMVGATVCPVDKETVRDPWSFAEWVVARGISLMHFVPSMFGEFLASLRDTEHNFPDLRQLVFSGEALPVAFVRRWIDRFGTRVSLANLYGPTEASIDVTCHHIHTRPTDDERSVPIGRAIDNVELRVLNDDLQPVPPGTPGELWIGGVQLAHEYLHNPEETARAFRANPVDGDSGQPQYRTGDRVVERADGALEYLGRLDSQVKIRGFRIELGEVESVLGAVEGVEECAVSAVEAGDEGQRRLVAWYTGRAYAAADLRRRLAQTLPDYMTPHQFVRRTALPKSANGKLDRKGLTLDDDAGGEQAGAGPESAAPAPAENTVTTLPLGPAQRWLVDHFKGAAHWAGYTTFRYLGDLDTEAFAAALTALEQRHSALGTRFTRDDGVWLQQVHAEPRGAALKVIDARDRSESEIVTELVERLRALGLALRADADRPLWHVLVMREADHSWRIGFVAHHMVCDLVSTDVILRDIWRIYDHGAEELLPVAGYDAFVASLVKAERTGALERHFEYWRRNCPSPGRAFVVPRDWPLGRNTEASGTSLRFAFDSRLNHFLKREGRRAFRTRLYAVLLAPLYRLMHEWTGRSDVTVSHRGHGRGVETRFFASVGNFAINYPVAVEVAEGQHWGKLVKRIHEALTSVPMEGATYDWIGHRLPDGCYPDSRLTPVRVNYLGSQSVPSDPRFEWCATDHAQRLASPDSERTALLEFFFHSADGCLRLEIAYSSACHEAATVRWLGERYLELATSLAAAVRMEGDENSMEVVADA